MTGFATSANPGAQTMKASLHRIVNVAGDFGLLQCT